MKSKEEGMNKQIVHLGNIFGVCPTCGQPGWRKDLLSMGQCSWCAWNKIRVFLHIIDGKRMFRFAVRGKIYSCPIVGDHEYCVESVDYLGAELQRLTGSREYKPMYSWKS